MVEPHKPDPLTIDSASTDKSQISVVMSALTGTDTGGSPILSYSLEVDEFTGTTWTAVIGLTTYQTDLTYTYTAVSPGQKYKFRYRALNVFGWSDYSDELAKRAATEPAKPTAPTTTNTGVSVKIEWSTPSNEGAAITAYLLEIRTSVSTTFSTETDYCDGSDSGNISNMYCIVPISELTAAPFNLVQGDVVYARVSAINEIGTSEVSDLSGDDGAEIRTVPLAPTSGPSRGSNSDEDNLHIVIQPLTGVNTGGSAITSYNIEWDQGTSTWAELVGYTTNSLLTEFTQSSGLSDGQDYKVRYRAENLFGFGPYSPETTITAITAPNQMSIDSFAVVGTNVVISWSAPDLRGGTIQGYTLKIRQSDDTTYTVDSVNCPTTTTTTSCTIPMTVFTSSPYLLEAGDLIVSVIAAENEFDVGAFSTPNTAGEVAQTIPDDPTQIPFKVNGATLSTAFSIEMPAIPNGEDGESAITSYALYWNSGSGSVFTALVGEASDSTARVYPLTGATEGTTYRFKYKAKNIYGFSAGYSGHVDILAAIEPSAPTGISATIDANSKLHIDWTAPSNNGAAISEYLIEIKDSNGAYQTESTHCSGLNTDVLANSECFVPLTHLENTYNLQVGDTVFIRISAENSQGWGATAEYSGGDTMETTPQATALTQGTVTSTSIQLNWAALTTTQETGDSAITSYNLEWDSGNGNSVFTELVGETTPYTLLTHTESSLTAGTTYTFRLRAENAHGFGSYSSTLSILAAEKPA